MEFKTAYGMSFAEGYSDLEIEMYFIRNGGYVSKGGKRLGRGKFWHYRAMMDLCWPEDDHHRWSDLMLRRKCENEILVMMGSGDSNKTYSTSRYVLCDWWAHASNTLWLVSSTELRGAELRIWGKLKELFNRARARYPWLPGTVLEARTCITTEEITRDGSEGRLLTKGIIFIPCKSGETWVGLGSYAGIKPTKDGRLGHAGDEVSFMETSFLQAYANWYGKSNFQGIMDGNPIDLEDPLCTAAEPIDGWDHWEDSKKTQEWRSKFYGAWVIAFDGRDSPNFDYDQKLPAKFPYLISKKKIDAVARVEGEDSALYQMQCVGKPLPGMEKKKVITRQLCEQNRAFEEAVWQGGNIIEVCSLDAAYGGEGGDRCAFNRTRFGPDVSGRTIVACHPPEIVPIRLALPEPAEIQIARWCKARCEALAVPPRQFFFDSRATLALIFAQVWSTDVNVIDFGGPATARPVSQDHYVTDEVTKQKRLKRCDEHYSKFVTELWFAIYYLVRSQQLRQLPRSVAAEGCRRIWEFTKGAPPRIEVESKKEMKLRTGKSPDFFDALVIAIEGARRLGLMIDILKEGGAAAQESDDFLDKAYAEYRRRMNKLELKAT